MRRPRAIRAADLARIQVEPDVVLRRLSYSQLCTRATT